MEFRIRSWACLAVLPLLVLLPGPEVQAAGPSIRVEVESDFGAEGEWTGPFVEKVAKKLVEMMETPEVSPPAVLHVRLEKVASGGIGGWSTPDAIGFRSNSWPMEQNRLWIVAHELVNQFAVVYAGCGGFPSDWWSDGRSPYPMYVASLLLAATGHAEAAKWCRTVRGKEPDHALYFKLHAEYGFALFSKFFAFLRADGVDIGAIGAPWPAPDRTRSAYTIAYLSLAAGENLAPLIQEHGIGREPGDWNQRHPEITFVPYEVTAADVDAILAAREWLFGKKADPAHHEGLRESFRAGGALTGPGSSPIRFSVDSAFGTESDWVEKYLGEAAERLVAAFGGPDRAPPARIVVKLAKDAAIGAIGGGPSGGNLSYVSNCWPKDTFRLWILTRDIARLLFDHYGGGSFPEELGSSTRIGEVLAVGLLRDLGQAPVADWLDGQLAAAPDAAIARMLGGKGGRELFGRFLTKLRKDGVDLAAIGGPGPSEDRTLAAVAALSEAAGENLAAPLRDLGLGRTPPGWHAAHPGVPFPEYEITPAEVAAKMKDR